MIDLSAGTRRLGAARWRRVGRRSLSFVAAAVVSTTLLTGCHGKVHAVPVFTGLQFPAAFTVAPNNDTIWYAERLTGEIRRRDISGGPDTLVWTVPSLLTQGERGLLGLALHPNYPFAPFVYAYATRNIGGIATNQILRIALSGGGIGVSQTAIVNDPGAGFAHDSGRIAFGPDGFLYAAVGEHGNPANSQTISGNTNLAGKVLRISPNGLVPAGNPFPGSYVWAYGMRNSFGFAFDPVQGNLWLNDNGPTCNDEVNRIVKGGNYAWGPQAVCTSPPAAPLNTNQSGPLPRRLPQRFYADSTGITGAVFCSACKIGRNGRLLIGSVITGEVHSLTLDASRTSVVADELLYDHPSGVLSMETRPGQPIYFSDATGIHRLINLG